MNYKKDNSNKHSVKEGSSRGVSGYKQGINDSAVFPKRHIEFILKRLEKLSSAIYIVTDLVSDSEPLKWKLRQTSLSLLSDTSGNKLNISENVYKVVSFLDIALAGNIISEMNGTVLKYEFEELLKSIEDIKKEDIVGRLFLYEKNETSMLDNKGHGGKALVGNVLYKTKTDTDREKPKGQQGKPLLSEGHQGLASVGIASVGKAFVGFDAGFGNARLKSKNDKQERRKTILDTIKKKKEITVKDITILVSGCSEKTIQREFVSMVKDKILKKRGNKRWSKYSLYS